MKTFKLPDMTRGWFVGDFIPTAYASKDCEVMCRHYTAGEKEQRHMHLVATEITLIVTGRVLMNGHQFSTGDIVIMEPGEATDFRVLEDTTNVVVKIPSALNDKYITPFIVAHRALEPMNQGFPESSYEKFKEYIVRGLGIEFDVSFVKDGLVVSHDQNLSRITHSLDNRNLGEISMKEIRKLEYGDGKKGRIAEFGEILELVSHGKPVLHALHVKGMHQTMEKINAILKEIKKCSHAIPKLLVFDLKPDVARYVKSQIPELKLAPSVADDFDIERYNEAVHGTLISIDQAIEYKEYYDWVWLDEWDTKGKNGNKNLYTKDTFDVLRKAGYSIGLVTPELHARSPGLLGGESHADAENKERLFLRIQDILDLGPDLVCTDYPEEVSKMK